MIELYDTLKELETKKTYRVCDIDGNTLKIKSPDNDMKGRPRTISVNDVDGVKFRKLNLPPVEVSNLNDSADEMPAGESIEQAPEASLENRRIVVRLQAAVESLEIENEDLKKLLEDQKERALRQAGMIEGLSRVLTTLVDKMTERSEG